MSRVAINTGSVANDGTGDSLRIAGGIINDNFAEIYSQFGDGTDLTPTWDKTAAGVNTTSNVGIGTTNPRFGLEVGSVGASGTSLWVNGNARVTGILTVGSSSIVLDGNANKILVGSGISFDGNTGIISATAFYAGGSIITGGGGGGSGDSYWVSGATGVTTTSNVGIATESAPSALTVGGNSLFTGIATFRNNVTLSNLTSSSNILRFGDNSYINQSTDDILTFQINTGTDANSTDGSFVFRNTEPNTSPIPDFQLDALRIYSRGDYWNGLVRVYTDLHVDDNAFVGGDLQVGAASTLIGVGNTLGSFRVGAGGTVITTTSAGLVGIGTTNPTEKLTVRGNISLGDSDKILLGDNGDFEIYNDSSGNTYITNSSSNSAGDLRIRSDEVLIQKYNGTETIAKFTEGAGVQLNYGGQSRLTTVSTGVIVGSNAAGVAHIPDELRIGSVAANQSDASILIANSSGVGIGTPVPNSDLHVVGVSTFNGSVYIDDQLYVSGVQITGAGGTGSVASIGEDISTRNLSVSGVSTFNDDVSIGGTISVDGSLRLTGINTTIVGTAGTSGDIKIIGGSPFFYDGSAWREFVLSSGTPVAVPADTDWDNVILRNTFDTSFDDAKFDISPVSVGSGCTITSSPLKIGTGSFRNDGSAGAGISFAYRSEYDFTGPWTIEFWIYHDTTITSGQYCSLVSMANGNDSSGEWTFGLGFNGINYLWYWDNENHNSAELIKSESSATFGANYLNQWVHYALVREEDNGSIHFYINGIESPLTTSDGVIDNDILNISGSGLQIGGIYYLAINTTAWNNGDSIDAFIDDLRISTIERYTSIGISTSATFTPSTTALPTTGTLSSYVQPPGDKYGEITLGGTPTWRGTSGVTVSQQSSGNYRVSFASTYTNSNDYYVLSQGMDQGFASYVGIARSTTHVDLSINKQSDDSAVDTGSLSVQIKNHI